jgi:hypothetical protein
MEKDKLGSNTHFKKEEKTLVGIFNDFLNTPPTASFFRLYILSFVAWNKSVILYILFDNNTMGYKLKNWGTFVVNFSTDSHIFNTFSLYIGPLLVAYIFYFISLSKIFPVKLGLKKFVFEKKYSLYYLLKNIDRVQYLQYLDDKKEVTKAEQEAVQAEIKAIKAIEKLEKIKPDLKIPEPVPKDPEWKKDWEDFKKTSYHSSSTYFNRFILEYRDSINNIKMNEDRVRNSFPETYLFNLVTYFAKIKTLDFSDSDSESIVLNNKGKYLIDMYEWESLSK